MNNQNKTTSRLKEVMNSSLMSQLTIPLVVLFIWILLSLTTKTFFTKENISNLFRQASILGIIATGLTFEIISGQSDLGMGAAVGVSGIIATKLMSNGVPFVAIVPIITALGLLIGLFNGTIVVKGGVPAFIATLSTMTILRGFAYIISNGQTIGGLPKAFTSFSSKTLLGVPSFVIIYIAVMLVAHFVLSKTVFGRNLYAVGSNREAASLAGINVFRMITSAFMVSGVTASITGILVASRLASGQPTAGNGYDLQCVTACVIGGASLGGGRGTILGTFFGTLLIYTLQNGGNLLKINSFWLQVITGFMTVLAVLIDEGRRKKASRS